jgi:hypothetical protein
VRRLDDSVWMREWGHGRWHGWRSLDGHTIAAPTVAAVGERGLVVVGVDTGGSLMERRRHGSSWSGWRPLGGAASGDPSLGVRVGGGGGVVLAVRQAAGGVRVRRLLPSRSWGRWRSVPAHLGSAPTVLVDRGGVHLFGVRESDGAVVQNNGTARLTRWSGWKRVGS